MIDAIAILVIYTAVIVTPLFIGGVILEVIIPAIYKAVRKRHE